MDVEKLRELSRKATPRPWRPDTGLGCKRVMGQKCGAHRQAQFQTEVCSTPGLHDEAEDAANAALIVALRNGIDDIMDRIEKLERVAEAARTLRGNAEGMVSLEREAIADLVSWTNVYCIEESVRQVKAALADLDGGKG